MLNLPALAVKNNGTPLALNDPFSTLNCWLREKRWQPQGQVSRQRPRKIEKLRISWDVPSGEHTKSNGKSPFLMGKSTISMAMFNCYVSSPEGNSKTNDQWIWGILTNFGDELQDYWVCE